LKRKGVFWGGVVNEEKERKKKGTKERSGGEGMFKPPHKYTLDLRRF